MGKLSFVISDDDDNVTRLRHQVEQLQIELQESRRWNQSLEERLHDQQPIGRLRDVGVGGANDTLNSTRGKIDQSEQVTGDSLILCRIRCLIKVAYPQWRTRVTTRWCQGIATCLHSVTSPVMTQVTLSMSYFQKSWSSWSAARGTSWTNPGSEKIQLVMSRWQHQLSWTRAQWRDSSYN